MRQTVPDAQLVSAVQRLAHAPFTQSCPVVQWAEVLHVPAGRGLQRPPWHELVALQSVSAEQPARQVAFTHHAPTPQSALKVQLVGVVPPSVCAEPPAVPPPVAVPPAWAEPPPTLDEPPAEPPPTLDAPPAEPPPAALEPPSGFEVPPPAEPPPVTPPSVRGASLQKPREHVWPALHSLPTAHGRTQYPLMQVS